MSLRIFTAGLLAAVLIASGCSEPAADAPSDSTESGTSDSGSGTEAEGSGGASEDSGEAPADEVDDSASADADGSFGLGTRAPAISIAKWIQGKPVDSFEEGTVYVVEFWATWCGPCLQSMPHMASLQELYGDDVAFIGVTAEEEEVVSGFLERDSNTGAKWKDVLTYRLALDDSRQTNASYMEAANQNGIPCAFVVGKTGLVEWIGHPVEMDEPLAKVVEGTWDIESAKAEAEKAAQMEATMMAYQQRLSSAAQAGDFKTAVAVCDEILTEFPEMTQVRQIKLQLLADGDMVDEFNVAAAELADDNADNPMMLNMIAWLLADSVKDERRDLDLALKSALSAAELTEEGDGAVLDTVARVYFEKGEFDNAVAWQKKAIAVSPGMKEMEESLKRYEAAMNPAKEEPAKEEPAKEEPAKEEPAKEEPAKEEPAKEEPAKEEPAKEEPAKEEPAKEEPAKEEPAKEEPAKEEPATAGAESD